MPLYSHSRITCFENCPFRYKLKYIDKVRPEIEQTVEAFMGTMVHKTMEKLYTDLKFQKLNSLEELLAFYREQWVKNWNPAILLVRKEYTPENYMQMGEVCISNYYKKHHPFDQARTIGLEQKVMLELTGDGRYRLQGYMDRLACSHDGAYEIHDYKTGSSLPLVQYLQQDRQLALYALAVMKSYPNSERISLVWHFMPFNQEIRLEKTAEELEKLRLETIEAIKAIESVKSYRTSVSRLCDWCEFRAQCPEWAHPAKTEGMSLKDFLMEPGVKLVNRYAELTEKRKELDVEMENVKESLVKLARRDGITTIAGSGYNAKVWMAEKFKFPGKDDEGRQELEEFLIKAGLWKDAASLDVFQLSRLAEDSRWPEDIRKAVQRFARLEMIEKIYLRKKDAVRE